MEQYIPKYVILAEIDELIDKGKYHEEYDCAYRDGNNCALYALKEKINTIETKEVDLDKEAEWIANGIMIAVQSAKLHTNVYNPDRKDYDHFHLMQAARRGIELGLKIAREDNIRHSMDETPDYPCDILFVTDVDNVFLFRYMENGRPVDIETPYFHNIQNGKCWYYCNDIMNVH